MTDTVEPEVTVTYEIEKLVMRPNGRQATEKYRLEVPEDWKVTFGPAFIPRGNGRPHHGNTAPMALRFYESETKQRAIFTDVVSFRDVDLPYLRQVENQWLEVEQAAILEAAQAEEYQRVINQGVNTNTRNNEVLTFNDDVEY